MKFTITRRIESKGKMRFENIMTEHDFSSLEEAMKKTDTVLKESKYVLILERKEGTILTSNLVAVRENLKWKCVNDARK